MQYSVQIYFKENVVVNYDLNDLDENSARKSIEKMVGELDKSTKSGKLYKIADGNWVNPSNILAMRLMVKQEAKNEENSENVQVS